jgi:hypothetical protein
MQVHISLTDGVGLVGAIALTIPKQLNSHAKVVEFQLNPDSQMQEVELKALPVLPMTLVQLRTHDELVAFQTKGRGQAHVVAFTFPVEPLTLLQLMPQLILVLFQTNGAVQLQVPLEAKPVVFEPTIKLQLTAQEGEGV